MKSITLHGIDSKLDQSIKQRAKKQGQSLNKTIKKLLEKSLGINADVENERRKEFADLFGVWTKANLKEFELNTKDFEKIDKEDWK